MFNSVQFNIKHTPIVVQSSPLCIFRTLLSSPTEATPVNTKSLFPLAQALATSFLHSVWFLWVPYVYGITAFLFVTSSLPVAVSSSSAMLWHESESPSPVRLRSSILSHAYTLYYLSARDSWHFKINIPDFFKIAVFFIFKSFLVLLPCILSDWYSKHWIKNPSKPNCSHSTQISN